MSDEIIDSTSAAPGTVPQAVKTLAILSIVGSSIWGLLMLIITLMCIAGGGAIANMLPAAFSEMMAAIIVIFLVMTLLNVLTLVAAIKLMGGKKSSFILYAVCNGIWSLLFLLSGLQGDMLALTTGLAGVAFIVGFGAQLKHMK